MTTRTTTARVEGVPARNHAEHVRGPRVSLASEGPAGDLSAVIVGGGITGLAAAYHLARDCRRLGLPASITLLEGAPRFGGKIQTTHRDGFVLEAGPDSFVARKQAAVALVRELGLAHRLMPTAGEHRRVLMLHDGELIELPSGLGLVAPAELSALFATPLLSPWGKLRACLDLVLPARPAEGDESLGSFVRRRLGRQMLERVVAPLLSGIHGTDPEELSLQSTFPAFAEMERRHGSLIRGVQAARRDASPSATSARLTLEGGLGELVEALTARLADDGVALVAGRRAAGLERRADGGWTIALEDGPRLAADAVVLTTPPLATAELLQPLDRKLAWQLYQIRHASIATVSLGFRAEDLPRPLSAYGFVAPRREGRRITACTFTSTKLAHRAPEGKVLLRAFLGGPDDGHVLRRSDAELVRAVLYDLRAVLGTSAPPVLAEVHRFEGGSPQYRVGHAERVARIENRLPEGLSLAGCAYHGVGIPDCLESGAAAAGHAFERLVERSRWALRARASGGG